MELKNEQKEQAEYDRFVDFMARMYLKYGNRYRPLTGQDVLEILPTHLIRKNVHLKKGA